MVRIASFNIENLFARYRFRNNLNPTADDGFSINQLAFEIHDEDSKRITAQAIREVDADVIALQEVENLRILDRFNSRYLARLKYKHRILIDAFDPRNIDVALLSRYPIANIKTYRQERNSQNTARLFSRDCLEVDLDINGKLLTVYVNHFKSMAGVGGRDGTRQRRQEQVNRVAEIVDQRWQANNYQDNFIVLGDFNDYVDEHTSLGALVEHNGLHDVAQRMAESEQWTHYWAGGNRYSQLDYLLLSTGLAELNQAVPVVMRKGLPHRAEAYDGERFEDVGENIPKASDHCPIYMDLDLN